MLSSIGARVDRGRRRATTEDCLGYHVPADPAVRLRLGSLYIVADGVGGEAAGDRASQLAVMTVLSEYYAPGGGTPADRLRRGIEAANARIRTEREQDAGRQAMGTTISCAVVRGTDLTVAHVGTSRVYTVQQGNAKLHTRDHTWATEAAAQGLPLSPQARHPALGQLLIRALGPMETVQADLAEVNLAPGERLLLCTNGLTAVLYDAQLAYLASSLEPDTAAQALVEAANRCGGPGNIAVLVIAIEADDQSSSAGGTLILA